MTDLVRDVRHATRRLLRTPVFTLTTLLTLALGIGANTAIFSVVNGVLLRPMPFPDADRLVGLWQTAPGVNIDDLSASIADYVTYLEQNQTLSSVAIWDRTGFTVDAADGTPERVDGLLSTFGLLPVLGLQPALGRPFAEGDDATGAPDVAMLGYGYWQRRFGGDPSVIGRRVDVDGTPREIIGVLPREFWFMDAGHDLVLPLRFDRAAVRLAGYNFNAVGRMRPGVTIEQVNADVARMIAHELRELPPPPGMSIQQMHDARLAPNVRPLAEDVVGDIGRSLWVIMATIAIVLLIACANVANLLLVRAEGRAQEFAVRTAIGAGRGRLMRELLVDHLLLGLAAGAAGVGLAVVGVRAVLAMDGVQLPRHDLIAVDGVSVLFAMVIAVAASLAFAALPLLRRTRVPLVAALRAGSRNASAGRDRNATRNALTAVQVALALVLLVGSGLMIRTYQSLRRVQPGFSEPASLQTFRVTFTGEAANDDARRLQWQHDVATRLAAVPGVSAVSLMNGVPMTGFNSQDPIMAGDREYDAGTIPPLRRFITAAPGTFAVLGTPMLAGREYDWTDIHEERPVVIIGESFAREYWGSAAAAIGKRIRSNPNDAWSEIIGVAADIRHDGLDRPAPSTVYWPLRAPRTVSYLVRSTRAGTEGLSAEIRRVLAEAGGIPMTQARTMAEIYERSMARTSFTLTLLALSGGMALLLAVVGIYGVISYTVAQRTREIGIRLALGASHGGVQLLFIRRGLLWSGLGAVLGLAAAVPLSRAMSSLLFEVAPVDPLTYGVMMLTLIVAGAAASYLPTRRVTRVEPVEALRSE